MSLFDWVIVSVIVISIVSAAAEGFFFELFTLGGAILALLLAVWTEGRFAPWFLPYVKSAPVASIAAFVTIFFVVAVLAGLAGKLARWAMKEAGLSWVDRSLGAAFGVVRGVVVVSAMVLALAAFVPDSPWLARSELSRYFLLTAKVASWTAPVAVKEQFQSGVETLRRIRMAAAAPATGGAEQGH